MQLLQKELQQERDTHAQEKSKLRLENESLQYELHQKTNQLHSALDDGQNLRQTISKLSTDIVVTDAQFRTAKTQLELNQIAITGKDKEIAELQSHIKILTQNLVDADQKTKTDEQIRRRLHNMIQELKGNIRVFCRVRPLTVKDKVPLSTALCFAVPDKDKKILEICPPGEVNYLGTIVDKKIDFTFDKVFMPESTQADVFEDISQLVQSALDGYSVCIFAYGQTGSGKTFTMEGGANEDRGMINRAVAQIFETAKELAFKGWVYVMEASFLEIYNESLRDLLNVDMDSSKLEIKKQKGSEEIYVTDLTVVTVTNEKEVNTLLKRARDARSVAKTDMNELSSRSHSVFRLKIKGINSSTGENCTATLNLVDLAGSERLAASGCTGDRLKETQAINKSLSNLGQVITAIGNKDPHVPYRNSKLTYLLQGSLGGNSKSLMFVNISPLCDSIPETLNSLRFATKVNQCDIGTAKRVVAK